MRVSVDICCEEIDDALIKLLLAYRHVVPLGSIVGAKVCIRVVLEDYLSNVRSQFKGTCVWLFVNDAVVAIGIVAGFGM